MTRIKICGITNLEDASMVAAAGADWMGVVVGVPTSPRSVSLKEAEVLFASSPLPAVAVTVETDPARLRKMMDCLHPAVLQLHSCAPTTLIPILKESFSGRIWQVLQFSSDDPRPLTTHVELCQRYLEAGMDALLLDKIKGGSPRGSTLDWMMVHNLASLIDAPVILAGGLTADNVQEAVETVRPYAVNVASGVESKPGIKDPRLVRRFVDTVRRCVASFNC